MYLALKDKKEPLGTAIPRGSLFFEFVKSQFICVFSYISQN